MGAEVKIWYGPARPRGYHANTIRDFVKLTVAITSTCASVSTRDGMWRLVSFKSHLNGGCTCWTSRPARFGTLLLPNMPYGWSSSLGWQWIILILLLTIVVFSDHYRYLRARSYGRMMTMRCVSCSNALLFGYYGRVREQTGSHSQIH